jgi:transcription elongation GreA/GreB family factor
MFEHKHKLEIKALVLRQLKDQQAVLSKAVQIAAEATTHTEAKQEGKYDTRAIEASYLAGAQAERLADLDQKIAKLERLTVVGNENERVKVTSLICVEDEESEKRWYMILPGAAGINVSIVSSDITILSPESKLGTELLGKNLGEEVELAVGRVSKYLTILAVI